VANYQDHKSTGLGWWLALSLALYAFGDGLGLGEGALLLAVAVGLPATLLGAGFPDIDLSSSIPHRRLRLILFVGATLLALWLLGQPTAQGMIAAALKEVALAEVSLGGPAPPLATLALAGLAGALAVALLAFFLPPHRGLTHRWPAGAAMALALAGLVALPLWAMTADSGLSLVVASAAAGFFLLGFASHLYKDGLLLGRARKRR
jgi:membrane-bound metal-dependent hydrolase YbcI (DUF457 family)